MSVTDEIRSLTVPALPDDWSALDTKAVDTSRVLAIDAVNHAMQGELERAEELVDESWRLANDLADVRSRGLATAPTRSASRRQSPARR